MPPLIMVGSGPGIRYYRWGMRWHAHAAVSSGCKVMPRRPELWFGCDPPGMFPDYLARDDSISRHIPTGCGVCWMDWNATLWDTVDSGPPNFSDPDAPVMDHRPGYGDHPRPHSLLFAVQVAALLGYDTLVFVGVDLLGPKLGMIAEMLADWQPLALAAGVDWINISPVSALREFVPTMCPLEVSRCLPCPLPN